jgi:large subunit ribosomal protein L24
MTARKQSSGPIKMKLRKGDRVQVLQGKDRGETGEIIRVLPKSNRVIVEGVNMVKKHQRATSAAKQGGIIDKDMPMHASSVAIICSTDGPTRVGYRIEDGKKVRFCRKCEAVL